MCHITSGKVKTNMLLIWAGPDSKDIYDSFNLWPYQANNANRVLQRFEEFCELSQSVTFEQFDTSSLRSPNVKAKP